MEVPLGFFPKLWSFCSFLPLFFLLFVLALLKASIICPIVLSLISIGNSAVIVGLWVAHFSWTFYCMAMTKRLGPVLKVVVLLLLPVALVLWPIIGVAGSFIGGVGYGFFAPLIATFEAQGEGFIDKSFHLFYDGSWSTIKGSCTVVRDFTDFCFHSYFSYMDELREMPPLDENPMDIRLSNILSSMLVVLFGLPFDFVGITIIALWKSPYMLFVGWKRLLEDLIGREGPFLETVCVPFAGLAILLWPIAVLGAVTSSILSGLFFGLYGGLVVFQEDSIVMGFAYIVSAISLFDEYTNDLLNMREGSCFPRPRYRKDMNPSEDLATRASIDHNKQSQMASSESLSEPNLASEGSRTLKRSIQQYKPFQVWDSLFKSYELNGVSLIHDGLVDMKDIEECIVKGACKKLVISLPSLSILECLLDSAKSKSSGLIVSNNVVLTKTNAPKDKLFEWFLAPLFIMKQQVEGLKLCYDEEVWLRKMVMASKNDRPEDWEVLGFTGRDKVRIAQLQAIIRRLRGVVASMSRLPTFRRRFMNLVKVLYIEAIKGGRNENEDRRCSTSKCGEEVEAQGSTTDKVIGQMV